MGGKLGGSLLDNVALQQRRSRMVRRSRRAIIRRRRGYWLGRGVGIRLGAWNLLVCITRDILEICVSPYVYSGAIYIQKIPEEDLERGLCRVNSRMLELVCRKQG